MNEEMKIPIKKVITLEELKSRLNQLKIDDNILSIKVKTQAEKDQRQYRITMINKYHSVIKDFSEEG